MATINNQLTDRIRDLNLLTSKRHIGKMTVTENGLPTDHCIRNMLAGLFRFKCFWKASPFHRVASAFQTTARMLVGKEKRFVVIKTTWFETQPCMVGRTSRIKFCLIIVKLADCSAVLSPPTCTPLPSVWSVGFPHSHLSISGKQSIETPSEHPPVRGELRLRVGHLC